VDSATAGTAIALAPLVGVLLGAVAIGALSGLDALGFPSLLGGLLTVGLLAVLTRGMHLDGLADTADGLGCYGPPERALAVMRDGGAGPFAVVTLIVVLGAQAISLSVLSRHWGAVMLAVTAGRTAFAICCVRGVPAARPEGLGTLVAGSQPVAVPVAWWVLLAGAGAFVVPGRPWLGPLGVVLAAGVVVVLAMHVKRRFGGITGDVLGAACELAVTVVLVVCSGSAPPNGR
jgi:adenosylcobinamide-GDP ribazoletransferase